MSKRHYIIPIFVPHIGCPHNCVFCNQNSITGKKEENAINREYVVERVNSYLETINKEESTIELSFYGGTFTAIPRDIQNELLSCAKEFKDKGLINFIHLSTRPDYIDEDILNNLKTYSVDVIELGVQSMENEVLKASGRGHTEEDTVNATKLIKKFGFILGHQIMVGLPLDTFQKDVETTRKIIELKPDIARIYPALVIKDTPMEEMLKRGIYKPYSLEEAVEISKEILGMLLAAGIKVIRVGLQPTEEINVGADIIEGPFHPAFRELVEGSMINDIILNFIGERSFKEVIININPKEISKLYADKKRYFYDTLHKLSTKNIKILQDNKVEKGNLQINIDGVYTNLSIYELLKNKYKEGNFMYL